MIARDEQQIPLPNMARQIGVSTATIHRWRLVGLAGEDGQTVRLECQRMGCRWFTTQDAVIDFNRKLKKGQYSFEFYP